MAQYIQPLANDKYKYFLDQSTGFKMRVGQRNHFFVRDKELYEDGFDDAEDVGWENTGGYGDPGDEVVAGGRIRFGVRDCDWCDDIELTETGFDGVESSPGTSDGDWKCVGSITAQMWRGSTWWLTRYITALEIETTGDTTQRITASIVGTGFDTCRFEVSTDGINFTEAGTAVDGIYNATGLTANTLYTWKARLSKESFYSDYTDNEALFTWTAQYQTLYTSLTVKPALDIAYEQNRITKDGAAVLAKLDVAVLTAQTTNANGEALKNILNPGTLDGSAVSSPVFTALEGFDGDGVADYINSNLTPDGNGNYTQNSASYGFYIRRNVAEAGMQGVSVTRSAYLRPRAAADGGTARINGTGDVTFASTDSSGMWIVTRTASNVVKVYHNGEEVASSSTASSGLPTGNFLFLAININGTPSSFTTNQVSFYFIGGGLTPAEALTLSSTVDVYMKYNNKSVIEAGPLAYFGQEVDDLAVINAMELSNEIVLVPHVDFSVGKLGHFRIPFCELTNDNILIIGSDVRYDGSSDFKMTDIGIIRSSDYGTTFGADQTVFPNNDIVEISRKNNASVLVNRTTGRMFIFGNSIDSDITDYFGVDVELDSDLIYKYSDDNGATWSVEISLQSLYDAETTILMTGAGHRGITMIDGTLALPCHEIRKVMPISETGADFSCRACIIYSEDNGSTWQKSSLIAALTNEASLIEYEAGKLMLVIRRFSVNEKRVFLTDNLGTTWTASLNDNAILGYNCNQDIHKFIHNGVTRGLLTMPANQTSRSDVSMFVSTDFLTWKKFRLLDAESTYGYTCICSNAAGKLFVVYEKWDGIHLLDMSNFADAIIAEV